jgi:hypothetical protein
MTCPHRAERRRPRHGADALPRRDRFVSAAYLAPSPPCNGFSMPPPAALRRDHDVSRARSGRGRRAARLPQASGSAPCSLVLGRRPLVATGTSLRGLRASLRAAACARRGGGARVGRELTLFEREVPTPSRAPGSHDRDAEVRDRGEWRKRQSNSPRMSARSGPADAPADTGRSLRRSGRTRVGTRPWAAPSCCRVRPERRAHHETLGGPPNNGQACHDLVKGHDRLEFQRLGGPKSLDPDRGVHERHFRLLRLGRSPRISLKSPFQSPEPASVRTWRALILRTRSSSARFTAPE